VMLCDLIDDSNELNDLAGKPEHIAVERRLKRLLREHLAKF